MSWLRPGRQLTYGIGVKLRELDELVVEQLLKADHPEITQIRFVPTTDQPDDHTRLVVEFADGSTGYAMATEVAGPGIPRHRRFELPKEAL